MAKRRTTGAGRGWISGISRGSAVPLVRVLVAILVLISFGLIAAHLSGVARLDRHFLVNPATVLDENRPVWMSEKAHQQLRTVLQEIEPISIFAADFSEKVSTSLRAASPWIGEVRHVERVFPNRVRVEFELRRPVVSIEWGPKRLLLDKEARIIHQESLSEAMEFRLPILPVVGSRPRREPQLGRIFPDPEVLEAVKVASEIQALDERNSLVVRRIRPVAYEIRRSVQGAVAAAGEVHLRTAAGVFVEWGRAQSATFGLNDLLPSRKVRHLERILEVFPDLVGLEEARLNFDLPHYRQIGGPLTFLKDPEEGLEAPSGS
ncbi:MAG: hypothetical protein V2A76_14865 [Planctomycetota bacterium]